MKMQAGIRRLLYSKNKTNRWELVLLKRFTLSLLFFYFAAFSLPNQAKDLNLPDLGGASGGLISTAQEYELGQQWLRMFRSQTRSSSDPLIQTYTENLVRGLATHSDLSDKRLDVLVVANPTLNAFAVPGGVVGVHTGLFRYAETEQQFSSVIAHELAHLSQRHFARSVDEQKNNSIPNLAALLASILVLATAGGDAGIAAVSTAQAAAIDSRLRFSRKMEQEADRLGMATMVRAGMNPYAMSEMFESMLHASRFQRRPPEFLITHPVTESRVSDSKLRAQQYPRKQEAQNLTYNLVQARAEIAHSTNISSVIKSSQEQLNNNPLQASVVRYGLALALMKQHRHTEAEKHIDTLLEENPDNLFFIIAKAEVESEQEKFDTAITRLLLVLQKYPNNHPLNVKLAEIYMRAGKYKESEQVLEKHKDRRPKDDYVWYLLAEAHGLNGNILEVHTARTEYFLLNGLLGKAENHVRHAIRLLKPQDQRRAQLEEKLKSIQRMKRNSMI